MPLIILGATGSPGAHVLRHVLDAEHDVSVLVRNPPQAARGNAAANPPHR